MSMGVLGNKLPDINRFNQSIEVANILLSKNITVTDTLHTDIQKKTLEIVKKSKITG